MSILFDGVYQNLTTPWWSTGIANPANIEVSTITVNAVPAGNILLTSIISSTTEYNAPLIFQRPVSDPNAPSESLVMNLSDDVPTKPTNGSYITATKASGTAYDDIALAGIQVYGDQTTSANSGAHAYITGSNGNLILAPKNSVLISSLQVSSLVAGSIVSTTTNTANSYTATLFMSTPILNTVSISSSQISTNQIKGALADFSTINVSTLNAPNFVISTINSSTVNSVFSDTKVSIVSTLSLTGSPTNINLGLGNVIQGLIGGATTQALGVGIGGAGLITGAAALATGRTSGGVNSNVFQTVNGSTQLQFSTLGSAVSSIFLTVNSPNPLTTPGLEISTTQGVAAGTYCVRSVGDPLYITNNVSSIQMYGQWVPVIQPTATVSALAISSLNVSSVNNAAYPPPGGGGIPSTLNASTININGNQTQSGTGTFNWGGNTMSPTQVVLARPTSVNTTLTTTGAAFLNAGATVNNGLTVASGNLNVTGNAFVTGVLQGGTVQAASGVTVAGGGIFVNNGGIQIQTGNFNMTSAASVANITNVNVNQNLTVNQRITANAISTNTISTNNVNLFTINNQTYPPPPGPATIPSTLNASTINFDGGLNNVGTAPITTGTITTTNANVNFYNGNSISANTAVITNISTNNLNVTGVTAITAQIPSITGVSSINGVIYPPPGSSGIPSTLNASTINVNGGQTITNGGLTISGGGSITDSGKWKFQMSGLASAISFVQAAGNNDSIILDLNSNKTTRFYSTLLVRDSTWPFPQPSLASIRTYDTNDPAPYGSVITSNVSSVSGTFSNINISTINGQVITGGGLPSTINASTININGNLTQSGTGTFNWGGNTMSPTQVVFASPTSVNNTFTTTGAVFLNAGVTVNSGLTVASGGATINTLSTTTISTGTISSATISTNTLVASSGTITSLNVNTINSQPYPPPASVAVPVGAITIWAGGSDNGATQNFNPPTGWLVCDGSEKDQLVYASLFNAIGQKYAMNKPLTGLNFYLPDLTFAVPMGTPLRNYVGTVDLNAPSFRCTVQTWPSDFSPFINAPTQTWKITQTIGGTLNYGTFFPANAISQPGYPSVYVSKILSYDGNVGYVVVQSVNNSNIPQTLGGIFAVGSGTVPQDSSGTYLYTLGSYGAQSAYPQVTHNQAEPEVGIHTHPTGTIVSNNAVDGFATTRNRMFVQYEMPYAPNQFSTISTIGYTNVGTYTAPNFINMLYIIKF